MLGARKVYSGILSPFFRGAHHRESHNHAFFRSGSRKIIAESIHREQPEVNLFFDMDSDPFTPNWPKPDAKSLSLLTKPKTRERWT